MVRIVAAGTEAAASFPTQFHVAIGEWSRRVRKAGLSAKRHVLTQHEEVKSFDKDSGGIVVDTFKWAVSISELAAARLGIEEGED